MLFRPDGLVSPLTTKGDVFVYGASANQRLPVGSDNLFLMADSSVTLGLRYTSPSSVSAVSVTTITSSVTLGSSVDYAFLSGGTFAITLPNAASFLIKPISLIRVDQNVSLPIAITGLVSGTTNWAFYTLSEKMTVIPNGSTWELVDRYAKTDIIGTEVLTITGTSSNPTKGTTQQKDALTWYRDGKFAVIHVEFEQQSGAGGAAGGGWYKIKLPGGLVADTSIVTPSTTVDINYPSDGTLESDISITNTGSTAVFRARLYDSTNMVFVGLITGGSDGAWSSTIIALNSTVYCYGWVRVPIAGWKE